MKRGYTKKPFSQLFKKLARLIIKNGYAVSKVIGPEIYGGGGIHIIVAICHLN